jgi:hypothetical protein
MRSSNLADRLTILRDEVLATAEVGDRDPPGAEVFEAVVRGVATFGETNPGLDLTLHDAIARRLAWGDSEAQVLADASAVCERLLAAAPRALRDPVEGMLVVEIASEVSCAAARIVALAAIGRAGRERAARLREELAQRRLREALSRQKEELARVRREYDG